MSLIGIDTVERPSSSSWAPPSGSGSRGARIHTSCAVVVTPTLDRAVARWCFTVECERPRRWAAAFSDPATRTAATTTTSRSVAHPAERSLTPAASPPRPTHPDPRSAGCRLKSRVQHLSGAPERIFYSAIVQPGWAPASQRRSTGPRASRLRNLEDPRSMASASSSRPQHSRPYGSEVSSNPRDFRDRPRVNSCDTGTPIGPSPGHPNGSRSSSNRDTEGRRCDMVRPRNARPGRARTRIRRTDVLVGARGLGPPVPGRSAGARCRWVAAKGRSTSS